VGELAHLNVPRPDPEEILTRPELAERKKVSVRTVDRWVAAGMPSETWGLRVRRFRLGRVDRWLNQREAA
jgi:phage terminase Nu1 subunit (DNA packaging protein)